MCQNCYDTYCILVEFNSNVNYTKSSIKELLKEITPETHIEGIENAEDWAREDIDGELLADRINILYIGDKSCVFSVFATG